MKQFLNICLLVILLVLFFTLPSYSQEYSYEKLEYKAMSENEVTIYPNPVINNRFFVKSEKTIKSVEVLNVIGQSFAKVVNTTGIPYNILVKLPDCDKGLYMVKITFKNNTKIIKKILVK